MAEDGADVFREGQAWQGAHHVADKAPKHVDVTAVQHRTHPHHRDRLLLHLKLCTVQQQGGWKWHGKYICTVTAAPLGCSNTNKWTVHRPLTWEKRHSITNKWTIHRPVTWENTGTVTAAPLRHSITKQWTVHEAVTRTHKGVCESVAKKHPKKTTPDQSVKPTSHNWSWSASQPVSQSVSQPTSLPVHKQQSAGTLSSNKPICQSTNQSLPVHKQSTNQPVSQLIHQSVSKQPAVNQLPSQPPELSFSKPEVTQQLPVHLQSNSLSLSKLATSQPINLSLRKEPTTHSVNQQSAS